MQILLIPDSFKQSISAIRLTNILYEQISAIFPKLKILKIPMADGGEGSLEILEQYITARRIYTKSKNAYGKEIYSFFLWDNKSRSAYIESANTIGLQKTDKKKEIFNANSEGLGLEIKKALDLGAVKIVIWLGGTATNEAGIGALQTIGFKFTNKKGVLFSPKSNEFTDISDIIFPENNSRATRFVLATDVKNYFCGEKGASKIFARQKGASLAEQIILEENFKSLNTFIFNKTGIDLSKTPASGAAGGISGLFHALLDAKIESGAEMLFSLAQVEQKIRESTLVISGEGKLDIQSSEGKLVSRVANICNTYNTKLWLICGKNELNNNQLETYGFEKIYEIRKFAKNKTESIMHTEEILMTKVIPLIIRNIKKELHLKKE